jgi:hypothetical protein
MSAPTRTPVVGGGRRGLPAKGYTLDAHPTKLWVNAWLAATAAEHLCSSLPTSTISSSSRGGGSSSISGGGGSTLNGHSDTSHEVGPACLVLETSGLHTVRALSTAGVLNDPSNVVIPQPDASESAAMLESEPRLRVVQATSHALIADLASRATSSHSSVDGSAASASAAAPAAAPDDTTGSASTDPLEEQQGESDELPSNTPKKFGFVWLDYCGTLASRAGRQREADVLTLVEGRLLEPRAVLAITLTARGSQPWYRDELVDSAVLLIRGAAARAGVVVSGMDVVSYRVQGSHPPMHTVCARLVDNIDDRHSRSGGGETAAVGCDGDTCDSGSGVDSGNGTDHVKEAASGGIDDDTPCSTTVLPPPPPGVRLVHGWVCADGTPSSPRRAPCALLLAVERVASVFSSVACGRAQLSSLSQPPPCATTATLSPSPLRVLTLESKLAPVAAAVIAAHANANAASLHSGNNPLLAITVVAPDADDAAIASAVLAQCLAQATTTNARQDPANATSASDDEGAQASVAVMASASVDVESHGRRGLRHFLENRGGGVGSGGGGGGGGGPAGAAAAIAGGGDGAPSTERIHPPPQAVWLGYERGRPRPAKELVDCAGWADLNHLLASGALAPPVPHSATPRSQEEGGWHSTLGVLINADRTKLPWDAAEVDWVVAGVAEACRVHGLEAIPVCVHIKHDMSHAHFK